jgi:hypothetical protein
MSESSLPDPTKFNYDDPVETNPTEMTTIECGDEPRRLEAFHIGVDFSYHDTLATVPGS